MKKSFSTETVMTLAVALAVGIAGTASAQVLLDDNFDQYPDQAAFEAAWQPVPTAGVVTGTLDNILSLSAPQSIRFAITAQRNQAFFSETGIPSGETTIIRFSLDYYETNAAVNPYRQHHNLQDGSGPTSSGQLVALGLNNNQLSTANGGNYFMARVLGYTPTDVGGTSGSFFKLNDPGAPLRSNGWHNLAVDISDTFFRFYVDGILSKSVSNTFTLRSYDVVRIGSGLSSTQTGNVDNVKVEIIPEPAGVILLALGAAGIASRRRRTVR